ncbi:hypothetical protein LCGC14_1674100 [marine sediment metagenome]|uniref:Uncharacterized protein n=1 Tax=marine sediment metagenome TaxID=412755 RepID=A0A0F9HRA5_9ZZZZ
MKWILVALLAVLLGCTSPDGVIEEPNRDEVSWQWLSGWDLDVGWAAFAKTEEIKP